MFRCKDLLTLPSMAKAKIIAGKDGLNRDIRWAYKPETMSFAEWIHGHELLIISTAVIGREDFDLMRLVKESVRLNMSGILLLVGEDYIDKVEKKVLSYADENHMPVFVLPWNIPLIDVFEELGHAIAYHDRMDSESVDILSCILLGTMKNDEVIHYQAELAGYDFAGEQSIFVIQIQDIYDYDEMWFKEKLAECFEAYNKSTVITRFSQNLVGIVGAGTEESDMLEEIFAKFCKAAEERFPQFHCVIGIGNGYTDLSKIQQSFKQASNCIRAVSLKHDNNNIVWYNKLGFVKVLMELKDQEMLQEYQYEILGKLIEYDDENHTELIKTLQAYFVSNESIKDTAGMIFNHPNTVKYRIRRIEEILGVDFDNSGDRYELYTALLIYNMINNM
ncbi:MAG: PucR family transcriptional regulator [Lachnospiraceae bacterium]